MKNRLQYAREAYEEEVEESSAGSAPGMAVSKFLAHVNLGLPKSQVFTMEEIRIGINRLVEEQIVKCEGWPSRIMFPK